MKTKEKIKALEARIQQLECENHSMRSRLSQVEDSRQPYFGRDPFWQIDPRGTQFPMVDPYGGLPRTDPFGGLPYTTTIQATSGYVKGPITNNEPGWAVSPL